MKGTGKAQQLVDAVRADTKAPSAGAMRAARELAIATREAARLAGAAVIGQLPESQIAQMAELIDCETHVAELVEALEVLLEVIGFEDGEVQRRLNNAWPHKGEHYQPLTFADSALRRFKEGL